MDQAKLESMLAEATSHCYDAEEEFWAVFCALGLNLSFPLQCRMAGAGATLIKLDEPSSDPDEGVMAVVDQGGQTRTVPLSDVQPAGVDWLEAYHYYLGKVGLV